ncbi:hypothetical protein EJ05DRAFT_501004 [Pseudovirgaria hyperparasitica]|uniref:Uncharacterized protein n=1 Tax=Pseudovirgaria hyperparasitica TaxID=470096 RepID=A0A6A6W5M1_9PEZI|nr:uncharacterized protein EJ05DRAFT_501004 [Pseudovirgaria hyperparasitica]KAF2757469.1 hypothetical protein EJ05DRAFT_501004 [Pseudovirgaria hyperparasitica]
MTEQAAQTFQRIIAENRELLEKLQANQREMEQLANYMLSVDLQSSHESVKSGPPNSKFGRDGSVGLPLDSISSARSNSQRSSHVPAVGKPQPSSASKRRERTMSFTSWKGREPQASIEKAPSADPSHARISDSRPTGTIRFIPAPRPAIIPRAGSPVEEDDTTEDEAEETKTVYLRRSRQNHHVTALEAREELYGPDDRWYLPRR